MTPTEQNYAQIEKELLAVIFFFGKISLLCLFTPGGRYYRDGPQASDLYIKESTGVSPKETATTPAATPALHIQSRLSSGQRARVGRYVI